MIFKDMSSSSERTTKEQTIKKKKTFPTWQGKKKKKLLLNSVEQREYISGLRWKGLDTDFRPNSASEIQSRTAGGPSDLLAHKRVVARFWLDGFRHLWEPL